MHPRKDAVLLSSWSGISLCSSDPRSLRCAQAEAIAAGDAHVAIELTVDGDLERGATLDVADPRARSIRDEPRLAATGDCWASENVMQCKRQQQQNPNKFGT